MKTFDFLKKIRIPGRLERRLSLGEYKRASSWSKYLVSTGGEIRGEGEDEWSADMSQLFIGSKFAVGRHSRIYRGVYKQLDVAIKLMSQPEEDKKLAAFLEKQFVSEVSLLLRLQHPNIITFVAACKRPPVFCIITEYLAGGSLRQYLHNQEPHSLPLDRVLKFAIDIARGMQYLHSLGILHRDLKSDNLLIGKDMQVKVADFGISCLESQCGNGKGFTSTYRWMAPEMIKEKQHTRKVDVYSFGIVLWELLTALTPFQDMTPEQAAFAVSQKMLESTRWTITASCIGSVILTALLVAFNGSLMQNARPPFPTACPVAFSHLMSRCWSRNPHKRPHFDEIVSILEGYTESLQQDPAFFSYYKPARQQKLLQWLPRCIAVDRSES